MGIGVDGHAAGPEGQIAAAADSSGRRPWPGRESGAPLRRAGPVGTLRPGAVRRVSGLGRVRAGGRFYSFYRTEGIQAGGRLSRSPRRGPAWPAGRGFRGGRVDSTPAARLSGPAAFGPGSFRARQLSGPAAFGPDSGPQARKESN